MAKLILNDVGYIPSSGPTINNNNDLIVAAIENTLSRDGTAPNEMNADIDVNNNRIFNLPAAISNTEPIRLAEAQPIIDGLAIIDDAVQAAQLAEINAEAAANAASAAADDAEDFADDAADSAAEAANTLAKSVRVDVVQSFSTPEQQQGRTNLSIVSNNIPSLAVGGVSATNVQAAIAELDTDKLNVSAVSAFGLSLIDDVNAPTARATLVISAANTPMTPVGGVAASDVQAAIQELDSEKLAASAVSAFGLTLVDDVNAAAARTTLGAFPLVGVTAGTNAPAGEVGEIIKSEILSASQVALTTGVYANITSLSLTAGDWDVSGVVWIDPADTTSISVMNGNISLVSATLDAAPSRWVRYQVRDAFVAGANFFMSLTLPVSQINVSATTTVYLLAQGNFTESTCGAYGYIQARRTR